MYSTLIFNNELIKEIRESDIYHMMIAALIIIGVFSTFFISYAHSSFIKSRYKEFALFMTLGLTKKDINKIIRIENSLVVLFSMGLGIISGGVFSKFFFIIIIKTLRLKNIIFLIHYKSFILTILVFTLIYTILIIFTRKTTSKLEVTELFRKTRKGYKNKNTNPILGIIGVIGLISSYILVHLNLSQIIFKNKPGYSIIFITITLISMYIIISQFGSILLVFFSNSKKRYFRNILNVTEIKYKFNSYKKILYVLCILSSVAIFFIGMTYSFYVVVFDTIKHEHPYDIMYVETYKANKLSDSDINEIISDNDNKLVKRKSLEYINLRLTKTTSGKKDSIWGSVVVLSNDKFNEISNKTLKVGKGNAVALSPNEEINDWYEVKEPITLWDESKKYIFDFQDEIADAIVNSNRYIGRFAIILNDYDYELLRKEVSDEKIELFNMFNFENYKDTKPIYEDLVSKLNERNDIANIDNEKTNIRWKLQPISKLVEYEKLITYMSFSLLVMSFIGVLFFITSGVVLYFKLYSDIEDMKVKYKKLYRVGISDNEMKSLISKELRIIFFIPLLIASITAYSYIAIILVNSPFYGKILLNALGVIGIYFMFQLVFYIISKEKYIKEVI